MLLDDIYALLLNYKQLPIPRLEKAFFNDIDLALRLFKGIDGVEGVAIIQTCNRVELYCDLRNDIYIEDILELWEELTENREIKSNVIKIKGEEVLKHLFRLSSGLESMVIGEQEILRQVKEAYYRALNINTLSPLLKKIFEEAIRIGKRVRAETEIDRKRVSIAHVAVEAVEKIFKDLNDKVILIVGAGETGGLLNSALMEKPYRKLTLLFANRTYEKAIQLANLSGGIALHLDEINKYLSVADILFVTTSAPHYLITKERIEGDVKKRNKPLLIVDLSVPRNVDPEVSNLTMVNLISIDDLRAYVNGVTYDKLKELDKIKTIIEESLKRFLNRLDSLWIEELISKIYIYAEKIRIEEVEEALSMMNEDKINEKTKKIMEDMSKAVVKRILNPLIENLKRSCKCIDKNEAIKILEIYINEDYHKL